MPGTSGKLCQQLLSFPFISFKILWSLVVLMWHVNLSALFNLVCYRRDISQTFNRSHDPIPLWLALIGLKLKSWFQWNVRKSTWNTWNVYISLWNAQNSLFPFKSVSILGISDWRLSRQTYEKLAYQVKWVYFGRPIPVIVILWVELLPNSNLPGNLLILPNFIA